MREGAQGRRKGRKEGKERKETGFLDREADGLRYQVYVPRNYRPQKKWPVILFLHGSGERGDDGLKQTTVGIASAIRQQPEQWPAIVVMPQAPGGSGWDGKSAVAAMAALDQTAAEFNTDPNRNYITGLSMGGHGAWYIAYRHPDRFAAIVPVCGWISSAVTKQLEPAVPGRDPFQKLASKLGDVPTWIFHGEMDGAVPVEESRRAAAALENARFTELLGVGHSSWDAAYSSRELITWLFRQKRPQGQRKGRKEGNERKGLPVRGKRTQLRS